MNDVTIEPWDQLRKMMTEGAGGEAIEAYLGPSSPPIWYGLSSA
jgi:hypothetical protein